MPPASTLATSSSRSGAESVAAIGITNQRETVVAWDRTTGTPYGRAIVWQDRRTAARCDELGGAGRPRARARPHRAGARPVLQRHQVRVAAASRAACRCPTDLALGTIDAWLIWNLTGGEVFATDATNASRTMLFDIRRLRWDDELCDLLHVPADRLPEVVPSSGRVGVTSGPLRRTGRHPDQRHRRRPAGGAVRSGLLRAWNGQEHLRHGQLRAAQRRTRPARRRAEGMLTTVAWTLADGDRRLRPGGCDLLDRVGDPVVARRARDHRRRCRSRAAGSHRRRQRRRVRRPGVHRAGLAVVGPLRPRHDRRHHPRHDPCPPGPGRRRVDGVPDP